MMSMSLAELCETAKGKRPFRGIVRLPKPCRFCGELFTVASRGRLERGHCYARLCEEKREHEKNTVMRDRYRNRVGLR